MYSPQKDGRKQDYPPQICGKQEDVGAFFEEAADYAHYIAFGNVLLYRTRYMRRRNLYNSTNIDRLSAFYDDLQLNPRTGQFGEMKHSGIRWNQYYPYHWVQMDGCENEYEYKPWVSKLYLSHHPEAQHHLCRTTCPPRDDCWDAWDNDSDGDAREEDLKNGMDVKIDDGENNDNRAFSQNLKC